MRYGTYILIVLLLGLHFFFLANLQFTAWPEMLSYSYLRNHGFLIYKDMIHPYPPLLTMGLSWTYTLFGYNLWILKSVAWVVILVSDILVFIIARSITRRDAPAFFVTAAYVFLQPFLDGNMLWFDIAIVLPILLGTLFLLRHNLFLAGLFFAAAALTKQTAGLYLLFTILYLLLIKKTSFNQLKYLFYGPLILGIPLLIRLLQEGALVDFLNWTIIYPLTQFGKFPGYVHMEVSPGQAFISIFLLVPLLIIIIKNKEILKDSVFQVLFPFLVIALIIIYPRFSFFHFQTALVFLVILYGLLFNQMKIKRFKLLLITSYLLLIFFAIHRPLLSSEWGRETRFYAKEDLELAQTIQSKVPQSEKVFLLGLHSGLYVMAGRVPPKRWTDNFGWYLEIPGVQEEIIARWENSSAGGPPHFIFWRTPSPGNWFDLGTYQPQKIVRWIEEHYTKEEEVKPGVWLWERAK
ncbi:MAG: hypothetical protein AAB907_01230 [Patescibacteria group bacterium]